MEKRKVSCPGFPPKTKPHATFMQPLQCVLQAKIPKHHVTAMCKNKQNEAAITVRTTPSLGRTQLAPAAHTRIPSIAGCSDFTHLSSPAAATLHEKKQGFVLRLPAQDEAHATFMQPLQCVLQHQVANPYLSTHMATQNDNNHAAITLRSAAREARNA